MTDARDPRAGSISGVQSTPTVSHVNNIRRGVKIGAVSAAALALVLGVSAPASAADPAIDGDGVVVIGDAQWQFNTYGLEYGWDLADAYDGSGYMYYPVSSPSTTTPTAPRAHRPPPT